MKTKEKSSIDLIDDRFIYSGGMAIILHPVTMMIDR
jgi:hypothetical protein